MARELVLEVIARKNSRELNTLADDFEKLARRSETAGKSLDKTASFSKHLDTEIAKTKTTIKELGAEFDRTGNKDVFAKLRGAQGNLRGLEGIRRQLASAIEKGGDDGAKSLFQRLTIQGKSMGQEFGQLFEGGLGGALRSPAGIGVVVAAAGAVGNAMFAALLTGTGLAGIAAGIVGQLKDPRVQAAGSQLGKDVSAGFKDATSSFAQPLVASLHQFDREWAKLQPGLKSTFAQLSPLVLDLSKGTVGFVDNLVPALERAAVASKPLIQDLAVYLPTLGRELGGLFDSLGRNSNNLVSGLHEVEGALDGVVKTATILVPVVSQVGRVFSSAHYLLGPAGFAFEEVSRIWDAMQGRTGPLLIRAMAGAAGATDQFGQAAKSTASSLYALNQAMSQALSDTLGLDQANIALKGDLASLKSQLDAHSRTLDTNTAAGRTNASALLAIAADAQRVRDASIAAAGGQNANAAAVAAANAKYNASVKALEALAIKLGLSRDAVKSLLDKYYALANAPSIVKVIKIVYSRSGEPLYAQTSGGRAAFAKGGVMYAAAKGMIFPPSNPPLVRFAEPETGGEAYIPRRGISEAAAAGLLSTAAGWYGYGLTGGGRGRGGGTPVNLTVNLMAPDGRVLHQQLVRFSLDTNRSPAELWPASSR